jgi:ADP-heptose:LPS heptosyltransferase
MNVELMRRLDSVLGNAACRVFATAKQAARPFTKPRDIKKIAVMKFFGLGSIVVASPSLLALRDRYPGAELHFVTFKSNRELLEILGITDVNHFVDPSTPAAFVRSTLAVAAALRRAEVDLVIDLEFFAKFPLVLASLAGIPKAAGFYLTKEPWRAQMLDVSGFYNQFFHTKDIFLSLVYLLSTQDHYYLQFNEMAERYRYPVVKPGLPERAALRKKLERFGIRNEPIIVINANTSPDLAPEARKWPRQRYAQLADALIAERPGARVVFVGAKSEREYVSSVVSLATSPRVISLAGELGLRELLVLFADSELVISNDSGPMHLACLVDAPVIGLFFADSPTLFGPIATRARAITPALYSIPLFSVYNGKDIAVGKPSKDITNAAACTVGLDEVLQAAREMLGEVPAVRAQPSRSEVAS